MEHRIHRATASRRHALLSAVFSMWLAGCGDDGSTAEDAVTTLHGEYPEEALERASSNEASATRRHGHTPAQLGSSDLSVQYISRLPRFPKSEVEYDPPGYNPRLSAESAAAEPWPLPGETVSFVAHVENQGGDAAKPVQYRWLVDGRVRGRGKLPALAAGASAEATLSWRWRDGDHTLRFELERPSCARSADPFAQNDAREQLTNAIMFTIYTWPGFEAWMAQHDNAVGTRSGADWIQFEADEMNRLFAESRSDLAPRGVLSRIAIDRIVRVPEETPYGGGHAPPETCPTESCWAFGGPNQGLAQWLEDVSGQRDQVTMHEWAHQIGLIDLYQMDIQDFEVLLTDGEAAVRAQSNSSARDGLDRLFDGDLITPIATYESRPVWFALEFAEPRHIDGMRMRFADGQTHTWEVYSADTLEAAVSRTAPAVLHAPPVTTTGTDFGSVQFEGATSRVWLVHVERLDYDLMTHVAEWELYDGPDRVDVLALLRANRVAGTEAMPRVAWDVIRYNSIPNDLMSGGIPYMLDPYHAWALNTDADWEQRGLPLRRGWFGRYLFYIPQTNVLHISRAGEVLPYAAVEVFQLQDGSIPDVAKFVGSTDDEGRFAFPLQTTTEYARLFGREEPVPTANPFSTIHSALPNVVGTNGVLLFRITACDGTRVYRFLDLPQFNLEYARGHTDVGVYELDVGSP